MRWEVENVSKAELGQLRPPSQDDIERRIARGDWSKAQQKAFNRRMNKLDKAARHHVDSQRGAQQQQAAPPRQAPARSEPARPHRHHSVAQDRYAESRASATPDHVKIRRSIEAHIQRNLKREARHERFRELGQQAVDRAKQIGRAALGRQQPAPQRSPASRQPAARMEQPEIRKAQVLAAHRDKVQSRQQEQRQAPIRQQQQQQRGKEQDRGRSR
jgi:hypothetical protein